MTKSQTKLVKAFVRHKMNWSEGLNLLTNNFIISDHCITVQDVADSDCERVVKWLDMNCHMREISPLEFSTLL